MVVPVWDREAAMERVDDDLEMFFEVFAVFLAELPNDCKRLAEAIANNNFDLVEREAHRLKSAVGNLGGMEAHEAAHNLERAAYSRASSLTTQYQLLLESIGRFNTELEAVKALSNIA